MATAVKFTEANDQFGKPSNMSDNQCYSLPVCRIITWIPGATETDKNVQMNAHISEWQLTEEEIQEVVKTGKVYLKVIGTNMIPVSIHGKKPIYPGSDPLADIILNPTEIYNMKQGF